MWNDFYKNRINSTYQNYFEDKYKPFLEAISDSNPSEILEAGCGIGSVSKHFIKRGVDCFGFDNDPNIVELAKLNVPKASFWEGDMLVKDLKTSGFIVTHGVLEHFEDGQIEDILKRFPNSIHYVPLDKYETPSFGDERLLAPDYWEKNFKLKDVKVFNNGYDMYFKSNY